MTLTIIGERSTYQAGKQSYQDKVSQHQTGKNVGANAEPCIGTEDFEIKMDHGEFDTRVGWGPRNLDGYKELCRLDDNSNST